MVEQLLEGVSVHIKLTVTVSLLGFMPIESEMLKLPVNPETSRSLIS